MRFANWYILLLIPAILYIFLKQKHKASIKFSSVQILRSAGMKKTFKHKIGRYLIALSFVFFLIALARPQSPKPITPGDEKGIDIAMILDVSESMQSVDFEPNRLEVARDTIENFVDERYQDRIALVVFAGTAYSKVPLTLDHNVIQESLCSVNTDSVSDDGTAIGMAISVGINRLKNSEAQSKVMILVTDGDNNAGSISPSTASQLAKDLGIKIYTIGVGSDETIMPVDYFGKTVYQSYEGGLNEPLLKEIAQTTDGAYYRAKDSEALKKVFDEINNLEKTAFEQDQFRVYDELGFLFIKIGLITILLGLFLDRYYYIQIP